MCSLIKGNKLKTKTLNLVKHKKKKNCFQLKSLSEASYFNKKKVVVCKN